jgi:hypothetical protein
MCYVHLPVSFQRASEFARELGIPRIYISANSGARIGVAEEIKHLFKVAWIDDKNHEKVGISLGSSGLVITQGNTS